MKIHGNKKVRNLITGEKIKYSEWKKISKQFNKELIKQFKKWKEEENVDKL